MQIHIAAADTEPTRPRSYSPFTFPGFWREGECDLTVYIRNKSIIFICSQRRDYHGTSVTNAVEAIRHKAIEKICNDRLVTATASRTLLERIFLTEARVRKALNSAVRRFVAENSKWIEHYPDGTGVAYEDAYAMIHFTASGEPAWSYVTRETLENRFPEVSFPRRQEV
jgi:hypothetical protein